MARSLLVATRKGLFTFRRRGAGSWRADAPAFLAVPVSAVLQDARDGGVYAALDHGHFGCKLHRCDGGKWQEVAVPHYPKPPDGHVAEDGIGRPWPWKLKLIWSLEVDPSAPGALWCGTIPGGLFRSTDRGQSWQLVRSLWDRDERLQWFGGGFDLPGIHSICVDPRDPARVQVGISCGGVWTTDDGGQQWRNTAHGMRAAFMPKDKQLDPNIQDPHRVVQCRGAPERLWCQHHNGIFRTGGGRGAKAGRWQEVKAAAPSRFGFACAVHPQDPDTAWFVPAQKDECRVPVDGRLCVTRTRDGGRTFEVLGKGLPKPPAWDLVLRHALDLAADGNTLAFGSTTGGLWLSENGGRSFAELSAHLPPVYAVRFAEA